MLEATTVNRFDLSPRNANDVARIGCVIKRTVTMRLLWRIKLTDCSQQQREWDDHHPPLIWEENPCSPDGDNVTDNRLGRGHNWSNINGG